MTSGNFFKSLISLKRDPKDWGETNDLKTLYNKIAQVLCSQVQNLEINDIQRMASFLENYTGQRVNSNSRIFNIITPDTPNWALRGFLINSNSTNIISIVGDLLEKMAEYVINEKGQFRLSDINNFCLEMKKKLNNYHKERLHMRIHALHQTKIRYNQAQVVSNEKRQISESDESKIDLYKSLKRLQSNTVTIHKTMNETFYNSEVVDKLNQTFSIDTAIKRSIRSLVFIKTLSQQLVINDLNKKLHYPTPVERKESVGRKKALPVGLEPTSCPTKEPLSRKISKTKNFNNQADTVMIRSRKLNITGAITKTTLRNNNNTKEGLKNMNIRTPTIKVSCNLVKQQTKVFKSVGGQKVDNTYAASPATLQEKYNSHKNEQQLKTPIKCVNATNKLNISNTNIKSKYNATNKRQSPPKPAATTPKPAATSKRPLSAKEVNKKNSNNSISSTLNLDCSESNSEINIPPQYRLKTCKTYSVFKPITRDRSRQSSDNESGFNETQETVTARVSNTKIKNNLKYTKSKIPVRLY